MWSSGNQRLRLVRAAENPAEKGVEFYTTAEKLDVVWNEGTARTVTTQLGPGG